MKKLLVVLFVLLINQFALLAQDKGLESSPIVIKGTLFELVNNEKVALPFANVFIEGTDALTTSDFDGTFTLETDESVSNLKCTFRGYEAFVKEIDAQGVKQIELEILLKPEGTAMNTAENVSKI